MNRFCLITGATLGVLGVAIGAFGAHALKPLLIENNRLDTFELAVRYQFYHSFALLATGLMSAHFNSKMFRTAGIFFLFGVIIFSGSLYTLSLTGIKILGAITPFGGVALIIGWCFMIGGLLKK